MSTLDNQRTNMGYLEDFEKAIESHDAPKILRLWEEYTSSDEVDPQDFLDILEVIKASELHEYIGRHIERAIPIWEKIENEDYSGKILRLMVDLEMSNNKHLRELTADYLEKKYADDPKYREKVRLISLKKNKGDFKGAISNYELLSHLEVGNFVFHTGGWGVGEIMEVSVLREQASFEFDYAPGIKEIPFKVAFASLIPIPSDHFLAQRFGNPDALEEKAKKDPIAMMRMLLKDLGPKTAAEIKDELCELVIPESEWNRWWQNTRAKLKKDTQIENPSDIKGEFKLLKQEVSHEERLQKALENKPDAGTLIQMVHSFLKDFSDTLKNKEFKESLIAKLGELLSFQEVMEAQQLQIHFFLQDLTGEKKYPPIAEILKKSESIEALLKEIPIQSQKKRMLAEVRKNREDWKEFFLKFLFTVEQSPLRDYILDQLLGSDAKDKLEEKLNELCIHPQKNPELVIWYFQKVMSKSGLPLSDKEGKAKLFEAFLICLAYIEQSGEKRDLIKKMQSILSQGRFAVVRKVMKDATKTQVQEFLLLVTKCHSFSDHDIKIFRSLAEVAHPSLKNESNEVIKAEEEDILWTTQEGYTKLQKRIEQIGTVETVDNAKEIEIARAHGDLRENAEFKAALERRDRLQTELKTLSDQLNKCRVLTKQDIDTSVVSVGTIIDFKTSDGEKITYTLLGPWDANPEKNILSFQSKLAKSLIGLKKGSEIEFQGKTLTVHNISSAL